MPCLMAEPANNAILLKISKCNLMAYGVKMYGYKNSLLVNLLHKSDLSDSLKKIVTARPLT